MSKLVTLCEKLLGPVNERITLFRSYGYATTGVDRMIMILRGEENIREVIAFPMNGNAQDLLCGAPGDVTEQQLREVHIKVRQ